jgi:capsular exopolysaccharide synthesis family protein
MAFLAEYFENTYQSPEEVKEDLDVPILGVIPEVKSRGQKEDKDEPAGSPAVPARRSMPLPVLEWPISAEAESFRTLATNIEFSSPEEAIGALVITSSSAGEGKSFAVANLAVAMAQSKGTEYRATTDQVVIVDCDMRKGVQHEIFGVSNGIGLTNLLVGKADLGSVLQDTDIPNLRLISCGPTPPNPVELLKSQRMDEMLMELKSACGVFICDSPPVLPVADALVLASKLGGVLLVADLNRTPREMIRRSNEQFTSLGVPLIGLICNRMGAAKYDSYHHAPHAGNSRTLVS